MKTKPIGLGNSKATTTTTEQDVVPIETIDVLPIQHETDIVPRDDSTLASQKESVVEVVSSEIIKSNVQELICFCPENPLKRHAIETAKAAKFPLDTTFLVGLGVYSAIAGMIHSVCYPDGTAIPLGLYILCEQPSGTAKTRVLKAFQAPFFKSLKLENTKRNKNAKEILGDKKELDLEPEEYIELLKCGRVDGFLTNATSAAIDSLLTSQRGRFMLASAEQGLINMLFSSNGDARADFDQLLKGFNGEYHNSKRAGREGYEGELCGSILCVAQSGTIKSVLSAAEGMGVAERFLMWVEANLLGKRDHTNIYVPDKGIETAYRMEVDKIMSHFSQTKPLSFDDLHSMSISAEGWQLIGQFKNELEPAIADGRELSFSMMRSIVSKIDIQVMKIAACFHLLGGGASPLPEINADNVKAAINIVRALTLGVKGICEDLGLVGKNAEFEAILHGFTKFDSRTVNQLVDSRRKVKPFSSYTDKPDKIRSALDEMVKADILALSESGKYSVR